MHELQERIGLQRGAADQGAVDVGEGHQALDVVGLDAAAVEDAQRVRDGLAVLRGDPRADEGVDLLGLLGGRDLAGADRPDRLVGDHHLLGFVGRRRASRIASSLAADHFHRAARFALGERLADARDRQQTRRERGLRLLRDALVGLAEVLAALRVAEDHVGDAQRP